MKSLRSHLRLGSTLTVLACVIGIFSSVVGAGVAAGATEGTASPSAALDSSCDGGYVCAWYEKGFNGIKTPVHCDTGITEVYGESAKNECPLRPIQLLSGSPQTGWQILACMEPHGERPEPGVIHGVEVLNQGEHC